MKFRDSFHPYAITTILFWALAYIWTRLALEHFTAFSLGFLRYALTALALIPVCLIFKLPLPRRRDLPLFAACGATGFFLYMIFFNIGAGYVTAATGSVIMAIVPVLTALLSVLVFHERLRPRQWLAIAIEFTGMLALTLYGAVFSANIGVLWLLGAALVLSLYNLLQRKLTRRYPALQASTYSIFFGALLLCIFAPPSLGELRTAPLASIVYVVLLGLLSSAVAYISWAKAMEKAPQTSQVSNYMFFTPFVAGLFGFLVAGEIPDLPTLLGGALILGGALLFNRSHPTPPEQQKQPTPTEKTA